MLRFLILFLLSKTQKTKNISVISLWLSLWFFVFGLLNLLVSFLFENPKIFCFVCFCSCLSKIENPKIFCVLLWFCKVCCRVQQSMAAPLEFGYHIILFKPQVKSNNDDLHSLICDERLVRTLFVFVFVHMLVHVNPRVCSGKMYVIDDCLIVPALSYD